MSVLNAYERSLDVLTPEEMEQALTGLHDLAKAIANSNGHAKMLLAGNYYRLHGKVVDSYKNMWEKAGT
jgi:hypothetical protein